MEQNIWLPTMNSNTSYVSINQSSAFFMACIFYNSNTSYVIINQHGPVINAQL